MCPRPHGSKTQFGGRMQALGLAVWPCDPGAEQRLLFGFVHCRSPVPKTWLHDDSPFPFAHCKIPCEKNTKCFFLTYFWSPLLEES